MPPGQNRCASVDYDMDIEGAGVGFAAGKGVYDKYSDCNGITSVVLNGQTVRSKVVAADGGEPEVRLYKIDAGHVHYESYYYNGNPRWSDVPISQIGWDFVKQYRRVPVTQP